MISSFLHLVGLRSRVYYTLTNFRGGGGGKAPLPPPLNTPMVQLNKVSNFMPLLPLLHQSCEYQRHEHFNVGPFFCMWVPLLLFSLYRGPFLGTPLTKILRAPLVQRHAPPTPGFFNGAICCIYYSVFCNI